MAWYGYTLLECKLCPQQLPQCLDAVGTQSNFFFVRINDRTFKLHIHFIYVFLIISVPFNTVIFICIFLFVFFTWLEISYLFHLCILWTLTVEHFLINVYWIEYMLWSSIKACWINKWHSSLLVPLQASQFWQRIWLYLNMEK